MADPTTAARTDNKAHYTDLLKAGYLLDALRQDVRTGLSAQAKQLPPTWFYDRLGSELFEQITTLPEYYPTRVEDEILRRRATQIAGITGARTVMELGSGSSVKTRRILDALGPRLGTLISIDVSDSALRAAAADLAERYPHADIYAVRADYTAPMDLGEIRCPHPRLLLLLGSTIGNFQPEARAAFLRRLGNAMGPDDHLLLGIDLAKDPRVLVRAYHDSQGVTARFNLNLLRRLNRELGADFDLRAFEHRAVWNAPEERIEMRLRSLRRQTVTLPGAELTVTFECGEELLTETSAKPRPQSVKGELARAGLYTAHLWTDPADQFAVAVCQRPRCAAHLRRVPRPRTAPP
jgi:L-histidine N-alpha-methyltransferase